MQSTQQRRLQIAHRVRRSAEVPQRSQAVMCVIAVIAASIEPINAASFTRAPPTHSSAAP